MSVATISTFQPASVGPMPFKAIASEWAPGRWAQAVHQMRIRFSRTRAAMSAGIIGVAEMLERNLVAKEEARWWSSPRPPRCRAERRRRLSTCRPVPRDCSAHACARTGSRRLSARYCFSAESTSPERWGQMLAQIVEILRGHARSPANRRWEPRRDFAKRQHGRTDAGMAPPARACPTPHWWPRPAPGMLRPAATIDCAPCRPSEPMPVRTKASTLGPRPRRPTQTAGRRPVCRNSRAGRHRWR